MEKKSWAVFFILIFLIINFVSALDNIVLVDDTNFIFMKNDRTGKLNPEIVVLTAIALPHEISVGDFDEDGFKDVVVSHWQDGRFDMFWGGEGTTFTQQTFDTILTHNDHQMHASGVGDFDEDGMADIALVDNSNSQSLGVYIVLNKGNREFIKHSFFELSGNIRYITVDHFNTDGHLDLIVSNVGSNSFFLLLGDGNGNFEVKQLEFPNIQGFNQIERADFDGDGDNDLLIAAREIIILDNNGNGEFTEIFRKFTVSTYWEAAQSVDFDGDGILDIVGVRPDGLYSYKGYEQEVDCSPRLKAKFCPLFRKTWDQGTVRDIELGDIDEDGIVDIIVGVMDNAGSKVTIYEYIGGDIDNSFSAVDYETGVGLRGSQTMIEVYKTDGGIIKKNEFIRADANSDTRINIADALYTLNYLFRDGAPFKCDDAADANDDGVLNIADAIYTLNWLFLEVGKDRPPPAPFPNKGVDTTQDKLDCKEGL